MAQYRNINSGIILSSSEYYAMSYSERQNYRPVSNNSNDNGGFLTSAILGAVTDSAILGGLLGGSIIGGIVGDVFGDSDLMD